MRLTRSTRFICIAAILVIPLSGQTDADPETARQGAVLFRQECVYCHGVGAAGGMRGPDLTTGAWVHGASDAELTKTITDGVPGTAMQGRKLKDEEVKQIIAYLRSVQKPPAAPIGDPRHGEALFFGSARCSTCHIVNGRGGRLGPELSQVGSARSRTYLIESIREPNKQLTENRNMDAYVSLNYDTVTAVTRDGTTIVGVPVDEDTFTVQIMDTNERTHSLEKKSLKSFRHDARSLMPAYGAETLPESDLADLVAYLQSLRAHKPGSEQEAHAPDPSPKPTLTVERLVNAAREPQQWLTYSGTYNGQRYSPLDQINRANVQHLALQWVFQTGVKGEHETTPLVIDGVMYLTGPQNHAFAIDIRSGRPLWHYQRNLPKENEMAFCCGPQNRGFAALGDRLFMGTLDTHVVALDAKTGRVRWDVAAAEAATGHSFTGAPLVVKDKVIVGVAGGEYGIRGFIDAYDVETGKRAWRFYTIPGEGEHGSESWAGDSWKRGGAPTWVTGSYDPELNTLYWGTGNPGPQIYGANRKGDNLYSDSLVALDPDTGKLKWYFQFTPHDVHDWDSTHVPILIDEPFNGRPRKLVAVANRNGFFYLLDRTDGKFLLAKPYTEVTWAKGVDETGRPIVLPHTDPTPEGNRVCPGGVGGTNWHSSSYSPKTHLYYLFSKDQCTLFLADEKLEPPHHPGRAYIGSGFFPGIGEKDSSAIRAVEPTTGKIRWEFKHYSGAWAGVLSTAGGLVFSGDGQGNFIALDAATGHDLWHVPLGGVIETAGISYGVDGRQHISILAGGSLYTFALPKTN